MSVLHIFRWAQDSLFVYNYGNDRHRFVGDGNQHVFDHFRPGGIRLHLARGQASAILLVSPLDVQLNWPGNGRSKNSNYQEATPRERGHHAGFVKEAIAQ